MLCLICYSVHPNLGRVRDVGLHIYMYMMWVVIDIFLKLCVVVGWCSFDCDCCSIQKLVGVRRHFVYFLCV